MNKRVHEIAKERGLPAKDVLARLKAAGLDVKASSSTVDEAAALRALGNGGGSAAQDGGGSAAQDAAPEAAAPTKAPDDRTAPEAMPDGAPRAANGEAGHKRPTRDSLQGERTPGTGAPSAAQ